MRRGELYRVARPSSSDPRHYRVFVVVSRQVLVDSRFSTVICAPVYSVYEGLSTQVPIGVEEGLKRDSGIYCDELVSMAKSRLTHFIGRLSVDKLRLLDKALAVAVEIEDMELR